jgi:hypothetical protein
MQLLQKLSLYSLIASSSLLLTILWPFSEAKAHCKVWHPHHCSLPDLDPTRAIPGFAEKAWGEAGGAAYPSAASIMRGRHGGSQGLDEFQKRNLRPSFGDLVDQVVVIYNARMMDQWSAFGKSINLSGVDSAGQTYCNRIYIRDAYNPNDVQQVRLLAHEMVHSRQCRDLGGEGKFGFHYFREFKRAGLNYANNKLEKEADDFANSITITEKIESTIGIRKVFIKSDHGNYFLNHTIGNRSISLADQPYNSTTGAYDGELWEIVDAGGGRVFIKSAHGNYFLNHTIGNRSISLADQPYNSTTGAYDGELWKIVDAGGGRVFIKSAHGNYFLNHTIGDRSISLADQPYNPTTGAYDGELWRIVAR